MSKAPFLLAQKEAREQRKITQREVAQETGIWAPTISAWMNYEPFSRLDAHIVAVLCDYFGCSFAELVEFVAPDKESAQGQRVAVAAI